MLRPKTSAAAAAAAAASHRRRNNRGGSNSRWRTRRGSSNCRRLLYRLTSCDRGTSARTRTRMTKSMTIITATTATTTRRHPAAAAAAAAAAADASSRQLHDPVESTTQRGRKGLLQATRPGRLRYIAVPRRAKSVAVVARCLRPAATIHPRRRRLLLHC